MSVAHVSEDDSVAEDRTLFDYMASFRPPRVPSGARLKIPQQESSAPRNKDFRV